MKITSNVSARDSTRRARPDARDESSGRGFAGRSPRGSTDYGGDGSGALDGFRTLRRSPQQQQQQQQQHAGLPPPSPGAEAVIIHVRRTTVEYVCAQASNPDIYPLTGAMLLVVHRRVGLPVQTPQPLI